MCIKQTETAFSCRRAHSISFLSSLTYIIKTATINDCYSNFLDASFKLNLRHFVSVSTSAGTQQSDTKRQHLLERLLDAVKQVGRLFSTCSLCEMQHGSKLYSKIAFYTSNADFCSCRSRPLNAVLLLAKISKSERNSY